MISAVVVDTDVISFAFKRDTRSFLYEPYIDGKLLVVSFMTQAELHQWSLVKNWGARRRGELDAYMRQYLTVHSDVALCQAWGRVTSDAVKQGRPIGTADAWIAATALAYGIPLLTHNKADYLGVEGLTVLSAA